MKLQVISAFILLSLAQFAFASPSAKPNRCPSVSAIKNVGFTTIAKAKGLWYAQVQSNHFQTDEEWSFIISGFKAANKSDATNQVTNAMNSLYLYQEDPFPSHQPDGVERWACLYKDRTKNASEHLAETHTPPAYN